MAYMVMVVISGFPSLCRGLGFPYLVSRLNLCGFGFNLELCSIGHNVFDKRQCSSQTTSIVFMHTTENKTFVHAVILVDKRSAQVRLSV